MFLEMLERNQVNKFQIIGVNWRMGTEKSKDMLDIFLALNDRIVLILFLKLFRQCAASKYRNVSPCVRIIKKLTQPLLRPGSCTVYMCTHCLLLRCSDFFAHSVKNKGNNSTFCCHGHWRVHLKLTILIGSNITNTITK